MNMPDNASDYMYRVEAQDRDHEGCRHPRDMHWRYGCGAESCDCAFVPPAMNLVEAVRVLNAAPPTGGWGR